MALDVACDDNLIGAWKYGPTFTARLVQQTSTAIRYSGPWASATSPDYSGGSVRAASRAGASATYTFKGRAVAFVSSVGPGRGKAKVYVNGSLVATLDLLSPTRVDRVVLWQRSWSSSTTRTVKIVVLGTAGRPRVDVDAFLVLR